MKKQLEKYHQKQKKVCWILLIYFWKVKKSFTKKPGPISRGPAARPEVIFLHLPQELQGLYGLFGLVQQGQTLAVSMALEVARSAVSKWFWSCFIGFCMFWCGCLMAVWRFFEGVLVVFSAHSVAFRVLLRVVLRVVKQPGSLLRIKPSYRAVLLEGVFVEVFTRGVDPHPHHAT